MRTNPETMCWKCNCIYVSHEAACPECGSANGLVDFEKATRELFNDCAMRHDDLPSQKEREEQFAAEERWADRRGGYGKGLEGNDS